MNKYVVALYSNFDGSMQMEEIEATSQVEAGMKLLTDNEWDMSDSDIKTYDQLQQFAFDCDHAIGVMQIDKNNWKNFTTGGPAHAAAAVH